MKPSISFSSIASLPRAATDIFSVFKCFSNAFKIDFLSTLRRFCLCLSLISYVAPVIISPTPLDPGGTGLSSPEKAESLLSRMSREENESF